MMSLFSSLLFVSMLHLDNSADQNAFRRWFTFLAEAQYFRAPGELPAEIKDCAALIRYCYRESLRRHDDVWRNSLGLRMVPGIPAVGAKFDGVHLFRTGETTTGQFADAKTLRRWNTRLISRDVSAALPGDILFYRQLSSLDSFHTMVWIGRSQIDGTPGPWLLYHTGPSGLGVGAGVSAAGAEQDAGEVRRATVEEMTRHREPRWRPLPGNENFLGVYRWTIL